MAVLLTGGAGYIGSHTAVSLLNSGFDVVITDNYCNSSPEAVKRVEEITGREVISYEADAADRRAMSDVFAENDIEAVIHFAGLKAVGESVQMPLRYYRNNLDSVMTLLEVMKQHGCSRFIFSSSATVYGSEAPIPYVETMGRGACSNPYGWTKSMTEQILSDAAAASEGMSTVLLRYFNPIGAHESGRIGEDPLGIPNNLMPYISQVAIGRRDHLTIFGNDYPTEDGTCRRDYIHVMDLAEAHTMAVGYACSHDGTEAFNIGTGTPYSVLEIIRTFESVNNLRIPYEFGERRDGDLPEFWANADKAKKVLGWTAKRSLEDMCRDTWNWQKKNPRGYRK